MSGKIIIETHAFNAEKTIEKTILSVLAQTYDNWEWHLFENGSFDKTGEIIKKYAEKDSRIKYYGYIDNSPKNTYLFLTLHSNLNCYEDNDYFTYICADDTFEPEFMTEMLGFVRANNLDISTCISKHTDVVSGEVKNKFFLQENIFCETPEEISAKFQTLYSFYRDLWGHLISFKTLKKINYMYYMGFYRKNPYSFLELNLEILCNADKIGILAKPLHNYYLSENSVAFRPVLKFGRLDHFDTLCDKLRVFLLKKCGYISRKNEIFILTRLLKTLIDYMPVVYKSDDDIAKLLFISRIINMEDTISAFENEHISIELKTKFCASVQQWLKHALVNKLFNKEAVHSDIIGKVKYFRYDSKETLNYRLLDVDSVKTIEIGDEEVKGVPSIMKYILNLHFFLSKWYLEDCE